MRPLTTSLVQLANDVAVLKNKHPHEASVVASLAMQDDVFFLYKQQIVRLQYCISTLKEVQYVLSIIRSRIRRLRLHPVYFLPERPLPQGRTG